MHVHTPYQYAVVSPGATPSPKAGVVLASCKQQACLGLSMTVTWLSVGSEDHSESLCCAVASTWK